MIVIISYPRTRMLRRRDWAGASSLDSCPSQAVPDFHAVGTNRVASSTDRWSLFCAPHPVDPLALFSPLLPLLSRAQPLVDLLLRSFTEVLDMFLKWLIKNSNRKPTFGSVSTPAEPDSLATTPAAPCRRTTDIVRLRAGPAVRLEIPAFPQNFEVLIWIVEKAQTKLKVPYPSLCALSLLADQAEGPVPFPVCSLTAC